MSSALSGCKLQLDFKTWCSIYRKYPAIDRIVMVFDNSREAVYLASLRIDELGRRYWESAGPIHIVSFADDGVVVAWMSKEKYLNRFKRLWRE